MFILAKIGNTITIGERVTMKKAKTKTKIKKILILILFIIVCALI